MTYLGRKHRGFWWENLKQTFHVIFTVHHDNKSKVQKQTCKNIVHILVFKLLI
jgi:hypothetical protein